MQTVVSQSEFVHCLVLAAAAAFCFGFAVGGLMTGTRVARKMRQWERARAFRRLP